MITFAAWTGLRQGELFALQWRDVGEDEVIVRRSRKLDGSLGKPKNGQNRTVPLLPPARVLDQIPQREGSPFVFHSPRGQPLIKGAHGWSWQKVKAAARVECRWHDLRHFCATQPLELGLGHFAVSVQLGHTDGGALVTVRYGHPSVDAAKRRLLAAFDSEPFETGSAAGSVTQRQGVSKPFDGHFSPVAPTTSRSPSRGAPRAGRRGRRRRTSRERSNARSGGGSRSRCRCCRLARSAGR
jgi:Phage integrase family